MDFRYRSRSAAAAFAEYPQAADTWDGMIRGVDYGQADIPRDNALGSYNQFVGQVGVAVAFIFQNIP